MSEKPVIPDPREVQEEIEKFVREKFGSQVHLLTNIPGKTKKAGRIKDIGKEQANNLTDKEKSLAQLEKIQNFKLRPKDIKQHLDRFVIKQDEAKKALSIAVCDHYNHVKMRLTPTSNEIASDDSNYSKQNVLLLGPTGVGKTYLVKRIAELIGVPFVKADATRFTETGYVGANVDDMVKDLVTQAGGDLELAQYGIVYLDEADKLASPQNAVGRDPAGRGVQFGLLKLMEESEVDLRSGHDMMSQIQNFMDFQKDGEVGKRVINTKHILFIVSGAFTGLDKIIQKRLKTRSIGLTQDQKKATDYDLLYGQVNTDDLISFGFEPEFIGRLPIRVSCQDLKANDLLAIMKNSEGSIIRQYEEAFRAYGIDVQFKDDGLDLIAEMAAKEKTGARALMTICEKILRNYKFELPGSGVRELIVDGQVVTYPEKSLSEMLLQKNVDAFHSIQNFEEMFFKNYKMKIHFDEAAKILIIDKASGKQLTPMEFSQQLLLGYEHGLRLIQLNSGETEFKLGIDVVEDPVGALEKRIRKSYENKTSPNHLH
jgi:ATP-dependent Clp protease ATP-binding subunit ClpX